MAEGGDNQPEENIEMNSKSPNDTDKKESPIAIATNATGKDAHDKPPPPPRRDYVEAQSMSPSLEPTKKRLPSFPRPDVIYKPEVTASWMTCIRHTLIVFNLLIWLLGAVITALGIWVKVDREFWDIQTGLDLKQFSTAGYILIAVGVIIMLVGFVGCYGAIAQKFWMLIIFSIIITIAILMEIAVMAIVWSATNNKNMKEEVRLRAKKALQDVREDDTKRYLIDLLQSKLHCCGVDGPNDYSDMNKERIEPIPHSCTNDDTGLPYEKGCFEAAVAYFKSKAAVLGGIAISVFILQLGALIFTACVACGIKNAATNSIF